MGCGESRPRLCLDDFILSPDDPDAKPRVDKGSIKAVWEKKFPDVALSEKDVDDLLPGSDITEENSAKLFPDFRAKFLKLGDRRRRIAEVAKEPKKYLDDFYIELNK